MTTIGQQIKEKRLGRTPHKMTQQELADIVGVSREAVSQWESGDSKSLKPEHLLAVSDALQVDIRWLVTGKIPRYPAQHGQTNETPPAYTAEKSEAVKLISAMPDVFVTLVLPLLRHYAESMAKTSNNNHEIPNIT